jgi:arsenite methyltransferase
MTESGELEIRKAVKQRYATLAITPSSGESGSCCGSDCWEGEGKLVSLQENIPAEASAVNAGRGSPVSLISPKMGDSILDLGSGGGIDVFRVSSLVGLSGRVIGVDATPEMVWRARKTVESYETKYPNVEFRLGEIEHLPVASGSVDYVISNCVINLSPDKEKVFKEAFRVLKPGGVFAVADITTEDAIPENSRKDLSSWSACKTGAVSKNEYRRLLELSGFGEIEVRAVSKDGNSCNDAGKGESQFSSNYIKARKPAD